MPCIIKGVVHLQDQRFGTGRKNDGSDLNLDDFIFLSMVDGIHPAKLGTYLASAGFKVYALGTIDNRCIGHRLGVRHINRFAACKSHFVLGRNRLKGMFGDVLL